MGEARDTAFALFLASAVKVFLLSMLLAGIMCGHMVSEQFADEPVEGRCE